MNILYGILLGLVQGVAEFLPVSSSGHLALVENLLGAGAGGAVAAIDDNAFFNIMLHLATLAAVVAAYWQDVRAMAAECAGMVRGASRGEKIFRSDIPARRLIFMIVIATLPLFVILPFHHAIERLGGTSWFVGLALVVTGVLLFLADHMPVGTRSQDDMTAKDALIIGAAQALATIPGLSRSGTTITAGMGQGFERTFAVRFSFLMSLLSVLGAVILSLIDAIRDGIDPSILPACFVGMIVAGITGYLSIRLLQKLVARGRFGGFAVYCWAVGILSIIVAIIV